MRMVACNPMDAIFKFDSDFDRMFRSAVDTCRPQSFASPRIEVSETQDAFKITADMPGMEKDNIKIAVEDSTLTISGERSEETKGDAKVVWSERRSSSFQRSFRLADNIDSARVSADYKNGILEVTLPKKEEAKPRTIEVKVN